VAHRSDNDESTKSRKMCWARLVARMGNDEMLTEFSLDV
jgi:hypothetical protein